MIGVRTGRKFGRTDTSERCVFAPSDCVQAAGLRRLLDEVRSCLRSMPAELIIDLSKVHRMNARLLAALLLLSREASRIGVRLRLQGVTEDFRRLATIFRVLGPLEKRGIMPMA